MNDFADLDVDNSDILDDADLLLPVLSLTAAELDRLYWGGDWDESIGTSSNKFNPIMESKQQRSGMGSYWDRNPRRWESRQIKVASRRWRRSGKYAGQMFDDFETQARSRFSALEDRWYW